MSRLYSSFKKRTKKFKGSSLQRSDVIIFNQQTVMRIVTINNDLIINDKITDHDPKIARQKLTYILANQEDDIHM